LFINVITGIALFLCIYLGSVYVLDHLHQSAEVVRRAKPFFLLLGASMIPLLIFNTFKQFAEGLGFTKQAMQISIWGNVVNICLGIIFVKGLFGVHPMGIIGVGYATLIDRCLMAVVMGLYVFKSANFTKYLKTFVISHWDKLRCIQILRIGTPVALQYTFELSAFSGANIMIGMIGPVQQAAHQVAINMAALTYMMASGVSAAAAIRSGNHMGSGEYRKLRLSAITSYHIVLLFMSFTAIIFIGFNHWLPWIVTSDERVVLVASQLLIIAGFFQLFDGAQVVGLGILRGMGDVNIPTLITLVAYWGIGLPVGYVLGLQFHLGAPGVWYGLVLGLLTASLLLFIRFQSISKKLHDKTVLIIARD
jgi:MATE family multidrug resistance protein